MNFAGGFPCNGPSRLLPPPELGSIRDLVKQLQTQFEVVEAWANRVCGSNGRCSVDLEDVLCVRAHDLPVGVSCKANAKGTDAILFSDIKILEHESPALEDEFFSAVPYDSHGEKGSQNLQMPMAAVNGETSQDMCKHTSIVTETEAQCPDRGSLRSVGSLESQAEDALDLSCTVRNSTQMQQHVFENEIREMTKNISELTLWYDRLLHESGSKTNISPESIHHFIVESEGRSERDVRWISCVIHEYNEAIAAQSSAFCGLGRRRDLFQTEAQKVQKANRKSSVLIGGPSRITGSCRGTVAEAEKLTDMEGEKPTDYLDFYGFVELVTWQGIDSIVSPSQKAELLEIRESLIIHSVDQLVYEMSHLRPATRKPQKPMLQSLVVKLLEPVIGSIVFMNAITIGISTDSGWKGWTYFEMFFTVFFLCEVILKCCLFGLRDHFFGDDSSWNVFDFAIVSLAVIDMTIELFLQKDNDLSDFTMVRMARLAKITRLIRLVRLLRLRFFKELLLMIKGVIAGMRTLVWAFVLLLSFVYIVGVLLRQTVGEDKRQMDDKYQTVLFTSVPWSMFTVFRCLTADCDLSDGTPLVAHLFEFYGYTFILIYALIFLFVNFGIFNLIMAVFVENVMESARVKRQLTQEDERARVCKKLRELVMCFGGQKDASATRRSTLLGQGVEHPACCNSENMTGSMSSRNSLLDRVKNFAKLRTKTSELSARVSTMIRPQLIATDVHFQFGGQITREMFDKVIMTAQVQSMMDDLEIHVCDRSELFDVLDADGSGAVDVSELINGLLKLRSGGADKSDMVAAILGIRSIQKQLQEICLIVEDQREHIGSKMEVQEKQMSTFLRVFPQQLAANLQSHAGEQRKPLAAKPPLCKVGRNSPSRLSL